jgi:hypothetical protein
VNPPEGADSAARIRPYALLLVSVDEGRAAQPDLTWREWARLRLVGAPVGRVSTAERARFQRVGRLMLFCTVVLIPLFAWLIWDSGRTYDRSRVVATVLPSSAFTGQPNPYGVVSTTGYPEFFPEDPRLRPGDVYVVRLTSSGREVGVFAHGRFFPDPNAPPGRWAVQWVVLYALLGLCVVVVAALALASRRRAQAIARDLVADPQSIVGRYRGSWLSHPMSFSRNSNAIPVAIVGDGSSKPQWFNAPADRLTDLKLFEAEIARGDRHVRLTYHPNTRAVSEIRADDGSVIDFASTIDEFHPDTGLTLKRPTLRSARPEQNS